jgi:hypothetical protein
MGLDGSEITIPDAIISFVLKVFAPLVYQTVLRCLKKTFHASNGSKLMEKLKERESLYGTLAKHVERFLGKKAAESSST